MTTKREVAYRRGLTQEPEIRQTSAFDIDESTGLALPKGSVKGMKSRCKHSNVDRTRAAYGYRCKDCKENVVLVTVATIFMTVKELTEWQRKTKLAAEREAKKIG